MSKGEYVTTLKKFKGVHNMLFDDATHYYYIEQGGGEEPEPLTEEQKAEKKAEKRSKEERNTINEIAGLIQGQMYECIDNDDLAGAKALLKTLRALQRKGVS